MSTHRGKRSTFKRLTAQIQRLVSGQEVEGLYEQRKAMAAKLADLQAENARLKEALEGILSNVALDWYVSNFAKSEAPHGMHSGVVAQIHNEGVRERAASAFQRARSCLAAISEGGEREG